MHDRSHAVIAAAVVGAMVALAHPAIAFPTGAQFDLDALTEDGGGGRSFAGGPTEAGLTCEVCHTGAPGRIGIRLESEQEDMFQSGYRPGESYRMRVVLLDDWAASGSSSTDCGGETTPYRRCDENGFALAMSTERGEPAGTLAATCDGTSAETADARVTDDGHAITHIGAEYGDTAWSFCWTAPREGAGAVTAYIAVVDGGGGDGTAAFPEDMSGDDTAAGAVDLQEYRGAVPQIDAGCAASGDQTGPTAALVLGLLLLGRRRRRRSPAGVVLATAAALLVGCSTVKPHQKQDLARRKMVFSPDPTEDELDLHMQQSREGSAGGYGNAGGGCGCN